MLMSIATPIPRADFEPAPAPPVTAPLADRFGRTISYVRVSVTDRCDMRCVYCMSEDMNFLPKRDLLTLEELDRLCTALIGRGVRKLRITGGEPLVRRNIMLLFRALGRHIELGALDELTLTTNGSQLAQHAKELVGAGVRRLNVSLDTLDPAKYKAITRWGDHAQTMAGIDAAQAAGLAVKINMVALKGVNEDEIVPMLEWAHARGLDLTLIEVMPLGAIEPGRADQFLPLNLVEARLKERFTLRETEVSHRWTRALCAYRRNWGPVGLHHPAHSQFLRKLQSRARHLHRNTLHVPWPGGCGRSARAIARLALQ